MNFKHPKINQMIDNLLSDYPYTIHIEDHKKIYKEYIQYGFTLGQIKHGIIGYHHFNSNNSYSNAFRLKPYKEQCSLAAKLK